MSLAAASGVADFQLQSKQEIKRCTLFEGELLFARQGYHIVRSRVQNRTFLSAEAIRFFGGEQNSFG
jgi:hypothetical protein